MQTYNVIVTPQANAQMAYIKDYIKYRLQNPIAADHVLEELEKEILSLAEMPRRIPLTEEEPWRSQGVHRMSVSSYYVYFWIDEKAPNVHVIAVVLARKDQRTALQELGI